MKIGIISLYGNNNYGNKLQNYAVQHFFRRMGIETVLLKTPWRYWKSNRSHIIGLLSKIINFCRHIKNISTDFAEYKSSDMLMRHRVESFMDFSNECLYEDKSYLDKYNIYIKKPKCDYFVVGSDQVWNYKFGTTDGLHYLRFTPYRKRLSFAASFGVEEINERHKKDIARYLKGMRLITVRENSGKRIVKELIDKDVEVILDPTLLVEKNQWVKMAKKPECNIPNRYVFTYFIGAISAEKKERIHKFAIDHKCEVVSMNDRESPEFFVLGPSQFVYLINHAEYVITDSFHACAFSMIFQKNFQVMKRVGSEDYMLDRIITLLETFHIKDRLVEDNSLIDTDINYANVDGIINEEYKKVKRMFLAVFKQDKCENIGVVK